LVRAHRTADARIRRWRRQLLGARAQIIRRGDIVIERDRRTVLARLVALRTARAVIVATRLIALRLGLAATATLIGAAW